MMRQTLSSHEYERRSGSERLCRLKKKKERSRVFFAVPTSTSRVASKGNDQQRRDPVKDHGHAPVAGGRLHCRQSQGHTLPRYYGDH